MHTAYAANAQELSKLTTKRTSTTEAEDAVTLESSSVTRYSQPLITNDNDDSFRPIIPKDIDPEYISRNVFTKTGQYRVFEPVESDLRATTTIKKKGQNKRVLTQNLNTLPYREATVLTTTIPNSKALPTRKTSPRTNKLKQASILAEQKGKSLSGVTTQRNGENEIGFNEIRRKAQVPTMHTADGANETFNSEHKGLEELLTEYVQNFFNNGQYEPSPGLIYELQKNHTISGDDGDLKSGHKRYVRHANVSNDANVTVNIPRVLQSGRLLFFAGLKKIMWPIYMGIQVLKSLLFAMFLPTIIGSIGKLIGKGIISGSAPLSVSPLQPPQDLDFKDNSFNFDDDSKFIMADDTGKEPAYAYNQPEATQNQNQYTFDADALSRYGMTEQGMKMPGSYMNALQSISSASFKNSNSISGSSSNSMSAPMQNKPAAPANMNTFQTFQKVPATSLLLSNYDPFYSPLLSRLDSVFAQLKVNSENEECREKLICLMYAHPAKYAPYSNLVSAQLSRELNELRKPTSDNPDILRFFKYMRAAKDGQDGVDCETTFDGCTEFKDFENPAMVSTYNDINKLVQARKLA
ncbi:uncharacterized protein LOC119684391 [Teleopsis dalmanni]|uniref:uncharacterized protein LOC119684391 n=1 Tax=Teleopsis dalmanni TaxID=139649 RepID=UPI0018CD134F|nr:uncharacterized protein LOC119684391 [Teleopsis dalmanni]